jgi:hypothetical protein
MRPGHGLDTRYTRGRIGGERRPVLLVAGVAGAPKASVAAVRQEPSDVMGWRDSTRDP